MAEQTQKSLRADSLQKSYRRRRVVDGVSFTVAPGEVVGLLGPNGAGKTTSFNMVMGLTRPDGGTIMLGDDDLSQLPLYKRARLGLGYLAQEPSVFRGLTVRENFRAVLERQGLARATCEKRVDDILREFDLGHVADNYGYRLSGGERRRLEVARVLIPAPSHVLFDEPFAGIDPIAVAEIQRIIGTLRQRGIGVLITDHNVRETLHICDRAYLIAEGRIFLEGTPAVLVDDVRARTIYLGAEFKLA
jgi:lipopolysaccharide export system ATP-binding protein